MNFSGKMCLKIILKVTKNQSFTISLVKSKIYQGVLAGKIIITDTYQIAEYANSIIKTHVLYLNKSMIISHNSNSAMNELIQTKLMFITTHSNRNLKN